MDSVRVAEIYWLSSGYQDYINENKAKVRR